MTDFQTLYKLVDKFVAQQELALRAIERTLPSPAAEFAVREHLRAIESTLDKIERGGATIRLDGLERVRA
jgi:hypothetical protein